jgi:hypothetical protein
VASLGRPLLDKPGKNPCPGKGDEETAAVDVPALGGLPDLVERVDCLVVVFRSVFILVFLEGKFNSSGIPKRSLSLDAIMLPHSIIKISG